MTLVALALIESHFVREVLVAFFFFTVFYACLAVLVVLFVLVVDALDRGSVWLGGPGTHVPILSAALPCIRIHGEPAQAPCGT
jgi:hypothetical protein